jgi:hypothetical protein
MDGRGHAGAAAQRVPQVDGPVVLLQQVAKRFVREFLKVLHLIVAEKIDLPPGRFVELHALARHDLAFSRLPTVPALKLPCFLAASKADLMVPWPSTVPPALI